ncbi:hypothetical protein [Sodalis-like endosymbiont of Proechinophthirus fluctus]|uniref:hypothetical protein n=1 Tax=Sodalis-like endosymbiont of Proechinophthirus fluctus TaxID=1462730 RepID=UPI001FCAFF5C|nr:hypothetical protein [Sodalis-like endosymbiont of Proechinophthirus fluctus]
MRLLLRNMVKNAYRYCPEGSGGGSIITIILKQEETSSGRRCILQVMDEMVPVLTRRGQGN